MKTVLVLGANGQLGQALLKQEDTTDYHLIGLSREDLDVRDIASVKSALSTYSPAIVINTTAYHVLADCEVYPERAFEMNAIIISSLAGLCRDHGIQLVSYSTDYVFDGQTDSPYGESDQPNPLQMYGLSKYAGELAARNRGDDWVTIIRTAGVYGGKGSRSKKGNFITMILEQANGKQEIDVSQDQTITLTSAEDLACATMQLLAQHPSGIYHLVNEGITTWSEVAQAALSYAKMDTVVNGVKRRGLEDTFQRPLYSALKNQRAQQAGVVLPHWQDSLQVYVKELLQ